MTFAVCGTVTSNVLLGHTAERALDSFEIAPPQGPECLDKRLERAPPKMYKGSPTGDAQSP